MFRTEFEKKWLNTFAPDLTKKQYRDCYVGCYLWHVFSYELVPKDRVLSGDLAREAYNAINKENAITIQLWDDGDEIETSLIVEKYKKSEEIEDIPELYVVDKGWKWTYISTHENGYCGPYFLKID